VTHCTVTGSVDNGNGTETLTLNTAAPSTTSLVSWLRKVRLAEDTLTIAWQNSALASCTLHAVEIP
jgi:hypothetical protein